MIVIAAPCALPSVERSGVGEIVVVVDTSGSIGSKELEQFAGEINAIVSEAQPELIRVIYLRRSSPGRGSVCAFRTN